MKQVIINAVSALYNIDGSKVFEPGRKQPFVGIRQMVCYFLRWELKWTYESISEFVCLNHATIIFGIKNFENRMLTYPESALEYYHFKRFISAKEFLDYELLSEFVKKNDKFLSNELKEYLSVKL